MGVVSDGGMQPGLRGVVVRMQAHARIVLGVAALGLACAPAVSPSDRGPEGEPTSEQRTSTPRPAAAEPPPGGVLEIDREGTLVPVAELGAPEGPGHVERFGWTSRGLVYCRHPSESCYECTWVSDAGRSESLEAGPGCSDGVPQAELEARLSAEPLGPGPTRWRHGAEVVLVQQTHEVEPGHGGQPRPLLELGARRRDGGPPSWVLQVDPCEGCGLDQVCTGAAHLDGLTLSPDGSQVVALVHLRGSDGREELRLERLSTQRLADAAWGSVAP